MSERITLEPIQGMPYITEGNDIGQVLADVILHHGFSLEHNDVICVASKAVSMAEGRKIKLQEVEVSDTAERIQKEVPRKDPRVVQAIIDQTGAPDGSRVEAGNNYIAGWLPNGMRLTSAGVDKLDAETVILLPEDADASAREIGKKVLEQTGIQVAIIITDSDGRIDKKGATQIAIGCYGIPPIRTSATEENGISKTSEETLCDMLAASAALLMGQRGTNRPAVVLRGVDYEFSEQATIKDALN